MEIAVIRRCHLCPGSAGVEAPEDARASNRVGVERGEKYEMTFYGSSFIADGTGAKIAEADRVSEGVLTATFDFDLLRLQRHSWGVFRDRRPELYRPILTLDGRVSP